MTVLCQQPLDGATRPEMGSSRSAASPGLLLGSGDPPFWEDPITGALPDSTGVLGPPWPAAGVRTKEEKCCGV